MSRFRSFMIRFGAPLVLVAGIGAVMMARRGLQLKHAIQLWADSLAKGSGPLAISIPFMPAYLDGDRIGRLDSVRLDRHEARTVDSVRLVIGLSDAGATPVAPGCMLELVSFDPGDFKRALTCAADTAGLVPFGRIVLQPGGGEAPLYVARDELACAPWTNHHDGACRRRRVQTQVRRDVQRIRDRMRQDMRRGIRGR